MRKSRLQDAERISLFPFLAVLICTMGALLVLLVIIAQRAQARAREEENEVTAEAVRAHHLSQRELDSLQTALVDLHSQRQAVSQILAERREALSHVEDHMRRLRDQLTALQQAAAELMRAREEDDGPLEKIRTEMERVQQQIKESEQLLAETLKQTQQRETSYAVVPYEGPNETRRQPIYLDCRQDTVVLQPEGIELSERDFRRPLGPDNPLASLLRATSEYLKQRNGAAAGSPYPLLLVRPAGIRAYYAARSAMASWDSEFGYELVGDDWKIEFPPADPQLAQIAQEQLVLARQRHEQYVLRENARRRSAGGRSGGSAPRGNAELSFGGSAGDANRSSAAGAPSQQGKPVQQGQPAQQRQPGSASEPSGAADAKIVEAASDNQSLAETRGRNWALPGASRGAVPFTRPIRVEIQADRLVIVPRDSQSSWKVIAANGATEDVVEEFVSSIWDHMRSWGIAGRGMYWKPTLNLYVHPGGERRAAELDILLQDSGLKVNR